MAEPAWLLLSVAAWVRQILWHVTCGYRKCSPGSDRVQSNVWLCLNSPCVSSGSLPAIRETGHEPWEKKKKKKHGWDEKGPWGSSRPSGVLDSSAACCCLPFPKGGRRRTHTQTHKPLAEVYRLTVPKRRGIQPEIPWSPIGLEVIMCVTLLNGLFS